MQKQQQQQAEYKSLLWQSQPQIMESFLVWFKNENVMFTDKEHWAHSDNDGLLTLSDAGGGGVEDFYWL